MAVQNRVNITNKSIILDSHLALTKDDITFLQDAGRSAPLVFGTLLAKILASGKWVPFTDETAIDGTAIPSAVFLGTDIPAADLVAGDVVDQIALLGGGAIIDSTRLVIENSKTIATIIATGTINARSVEDVLNDRGIFLGASEDSTSFET